METAGGIAVLQFINHLVYTSVSASLPGTTAHINSLLHQVTNIMTTLLHS